MLVSTKGVNINNFSKYRCGKKPFPHSAVNVEGEITPTENG